MSSGPKSSGGGKITPVPQTKLDTTSWGGMGSPVSQNPMGMGSWGTGYGIQQPGWGQSPWFDMSSWWGMPAPNVGQAILQGPQGYPPGGPQAPQDAMGATGAMGAPQTPGAAPAAPMDPYQQLLSMQTAPVQAGPPRPPGKAPANFEGVGGTDRAFLTGINNRLQGFGG